MAFTRKTLKALGIEEDKIDAIMEEHTAVTDALKKERDQYKTEADKLPEIQKQLEAEQKKSGGENWKQKYDDLLAENGKKETREAKNKAFRRLAKGAGIADQYVDTIIKASPDFIEALELDGDTVKDADSKIKELGATWKDFVSEEDTGGPGGNGHPGGNGGHGNTMEELGMMSMADYIAARSKK